MINFENIAYLKIGNAKQRKVYQVLTENRIMKKLSGFSPLLTGTIPLEIDADESDLDIICHWTNKTDFIQSCFSFSHCLNFELVEKEINGLDTVISKFVMDSFPIEIFGQNRPTKQQEAYRHMLVEYHFLQTKGSRFKQAIIDLKKNGVKTEPAFGLLLRLKGDPYAELLTYFDSDF